MSNEKGIQSLKHHGNWSRHFLLMVTRWQIIRNDINFLNHRSTKMTCIDDAMWDIMDIFDDIYFELYLILLAIELDDISSLLASPPSQDFDPFRTFGRF